MNWSVEQLGPAVHRVTVNDVAAGWEGWMLLSSDRHHDSPGNVETVEKRHLEKARQRGACVIDYGDLFDAMGGRFDPRRMESEVKGRHKVDHYFDSILDEAAEFYGPYADLFGVIGMGNHETSVLKHHNLNLTHSLGRELRRRAGRDDVALTGGYGGYVLLTFVIRKTIMRTLRLKYFHGSGGGGPVTKGVIGTNRHAVIYPDADIVAMGHIHEGWVMSLPQERVNRNGSVEQAIQWHVCTPGYKNSYGEGLGGWDVERGGTPKPVGACWLHMEMLAAANKRGQDARIKVTPILDQEYV